ncbi:uncharacterized protein LOC134814962 [Bolinopsis microptera]|uniref:uncharacterized protein LOC134814962 n=1 Tax=Bolinopsis microptera TaxID=2820187 RepID=UPI0030793BC1
MTLRDLTFTSFLLASVLNLLSALNVFNEEQERKKESRLQKRSSDSSEIALIIVITVIVSIILAGMVIIIIAITCKLSDLKEVVPTMRVKEYIPSRETRKATIILPMPSTHSPSLPPEKQVLPPVEEVSSVSTDPPSDPPTSKTPEGMQTLPPPQYEASSHAEHAIPTELEYYSGQGKTVRELTETFSYSDV